MLLKVFSTPGRQKYETLCQLGLISYTFTDMKEVGLTDLVLPFHWEFHQELLGVGADEDKWGGGLLAGTRKLD